jgi:hypothetical protein
MAKSNHPAAKAGRFVRAFGLTLQSELEKRNAAIAAAEAAKAPPPPPPPPPPAVPTTDLRGRATFAAFVVGLAALVVVILHVELVVPGAGKRILRAVASVPLFLEGLLLVSNWQQANRSLGQRLLNRVWGPRAAVTRRERVFARAIREGLTLLGIAFLAAGVFELLQAIVGDASTI